MTVLTSDAMPTLTYRRHVYEVREGAVYRDGERMSGADVLRAAPVESGLWAWLREQGVQRPKSSGTTQAEDERATKQVLLRLAPDVIAQLERLAEGTTKSDVVSRLIRAAEKK